MNTRDGVRRLLADELHRLDERLSSGEWLCCCGPCYLIDGTYWAYARDIGGWHVPSDPHPALWPTGGA